MHSCRVTQLNRYRVLELHNYSVQREASAKVWGRCASDWNMVAHISRKHRHFYIITYVLCFRHSIELNVSLAYVQVYSLDFMPNQFVGFVMRQCYDCIESLMALQNTNSLLYFPRETPQPKMLGWCWILLKEWLLKGVVKQQNPVPWEHLFFFRYTIWQVLKMFLTDP